MPDTYEPNCDAAAPPAPAAFSTSGEIGKLAEALAKAQSAIQNPPRDRTVKVQLKTGGAYEFSYATMSGILDAIREPLTSNGIWFTQTLAERDSRYRLRTTLLHSSGEWISSETPLLVQEQGNQAFGSALTYMRRYALCAILGLSADEDDDGNTGEGNTIADKRDRTPPPRQPQRQAPAAQQQRQAAPPAQQRGPYVPRLASDKPLDQKKFSEEVKSIVKRLPTPDEVAGFEEYVTPGLNRLAELNRALFEETWGAIVHRNEELNARKTETTVLSGG